MLTEANPLPDSNPSAIPGATTTRATLKKWQVLSSGGGRVGRPLLPIAAKDVVGGGVRGWRVRGRDGV